ncbi:MAG TPA: PEP-CTERM sorting domain-containing protein [Gemmatales bacterium]|nr:PEP-CTERM sorting domain-containing protein [Gemmatales bacterium]
MKCFHVAWAGLLLFTATLHAQTPTEVVFRVGANSQVVWFDINTPSINGTLDISTNGFFGAAGGLNAALWDPVRLRIVFTNLSAGTPLPWYAIDMAGQPLVPGSSVNVTSRLSLIGNPSIGTGNISVPQGGYRPSNGGYYILEATSDRTHLLNQNGVGNLVSSTLFGNLNGGSAPDGVTGGDLDFSATDKLWMSGTEAGSSHLWRFGTSAGLPTELDVLTTALYNGITFDATRTVLFGYRAATQEYGIINQTTGALNVISTDPLFAGPGDLTTGVTYDSFASVPEPGTWAMIGLAALGSIGSRFYVLRRRRKQEEMCLRA